jgi:K+-transporting ATPase KdpF subunit
MADLIFIGITVVFFRFRWSMFEAVIDCKGAIMQLEYFVGIVVSILILGYLLCALLWPEKF